MENLIWVGIIGAVVALVFAFIQRNVVMKASEGDEKMIKIASAIRASKARHLMDNWETPFLTVPEGWYLGTSAGAAIVLYAAACYFISLALRRFIK